MIPTTVPEKFTPSPRIYALALERDIPSSFVDECIGEFIFYYTEGRGAGARRKSWIGSYWNWVKKGWSFKMQAEKKTVRTNPSANVEWQAPKIEVSKSKKTLKQRLREAG